MYFTYAFRRRKDAIKLHTLSPLLNHFFFCTTSNYESKLPLSSLQCGAILQSLTNTKTFKKGQTLHGYIISSGVIQDNIYLSTKLAAFYANCGHMSKSQIIFDQIVNKSSFLWNFMIRGYASNDLSVQAILLYLKMRRGGVFSDNFTYPFVVKACGDLADVKLGHVVHAQVMIHGFESDIYVGNCLLSMYVKFSDMWNARIVFDRMPERDLTSWNTTISGYVKNGSPAEGLHVFQEMLVSGVNPDSTTLLGVLAACSELRCFETGKQVHGFLLRNRVHCPYNFLTNSLIEVYCICSSMVYARRLFEVSRKDSVSWNTLISGYGRSDKGFEGLRLFRQMVAASKRPDLATFIAVLGICEDVAALDFGMSVHSRLVREGFGVSVMAATALIGMYSRCGELSCSRLIFDEIETKNLVSWTAMISAYGHHGKGKESISMLQQMRVNNIVPDEGTFTSILTACSHAGLVEEGREVFRQIHQEYNIKPVLAHYACLVDLLSRAGNLEDAYETICSMKVKPTVDIWASFLSGCRVHGNVTLAEVAGEKILQLNPDGVGGYICLSHIYADEKRWTDVEKVRDMVQSKGTTKPTAYSFLK
ncbi:hypothetical protein RND81_02G003100 [Saponaria officinalis]|uniref:Uncharacterized protein n=1 Tax=Saponaria officinalis TaxID=3572 RepID=A0AAW1MQ15_SAPOF